MTQLSTHLSLDEFVHSDTAIRLNIENTLPAELMPNAVYLANYCFEAVRNLLNVPIKIDSGYRCEKLNIAVRGVPTSQHVQGQAIDMVPQGLDIYAAFDQIRNSKLVTFDQLILEHDGAGDKWIHISRKQTGNRMQVIPYLLKQNN